MGIIKLKTISRPVVMCHFEDGRSKKVYFICPITKNTEDKLDDDRIDKIRFTFNDEELAISKRNIEFYGEMDFTTGSKDYETIKENYDLFSNISTRIPANYNYDDHSCISDDKFMKYWETFRPELIVQYYHGLLGKPKRCVIYKKIIW